MHDILSAIQGKKDASNTYNVRNLRSANVDFTCGQWHYVL